MKSNTPTAARGVEFRGQSPATIGNRWALIIGISQYKDERLNLQFADRDAQELYNFLRTRSGGAFADAKIQLLINEAATAARVTWGIRSFLQKPAKEDLTLIYVASHGAPDPARPQNLYILTHDTDPSDIAGTAVPMRELEQSLRDNLLSDRVVMFADTCHSAGLAGAMLRTRDADLSGRMNEYLQALKTANPGLALLTSSEANESSFEDERWGGGHGVFTHYLLKGLKGDADLRPRNGIVTVGELFEYVRDKVKEATDDRQHPSIGTNLFDRRLPLSIPGIERATELHNQAKCYFRNGDLEKSAQLWKEVLTVYADHAEAREGLENIAQEKRKIGHIRNDRERHLLKLFNNNDLSLIEYSDAMARLQEDYQHLTPREKDHLQWVLTLADGRIDAKVYRATVQLIADEVEWEEQQDRRKEEEAKRQAEENERQRLLEEKRKEEEAKRQAEESERQRLLEEKRKEEEAKRQAEESERQRLLEEKRKEEEAKRQAEESERQRLLEEKRKAEVEVKRSKSAAASRTARIQSEEAKRKRLLEEARSLVEKDVKRAAELYSQYDDKRQRQIEDKRKSEREERQQQQKERRRTAYARRKAEAQQKAGAEKPAPDRAEQEEPSRKGENDAPKPVGAAKPLAEQEAAREATDNGSYHTVKYEHPSDFDVQFGDPLLRSFADEAYASVQHEKSKAEKGFAWRLGFSIGKVMRWPGALLILIVGICIVIAFYVSIFY